MSGIFLFLSFLSFFFHWKNDQSQLSKFFDKEIIAENLLGKTGAILSHFFIHRGIGISALFIPIILFITGLRIILNKRLLNNFYKSIIYKFIFFSIWIPVNFYLFIPNQGILSGIFGFEIGNLLIHFFGKIGLYILIFTSIIFYIFIIFRTKNKDEIIKKIQIYENKSKCLILKFFKFFVKNIINNKFLLKFKKKSHNNDKITHSSSDNEKKNKILHSILFSAEKKNDFTPVNNIEIDSKKKKIVQILNYYKIEICKIKAIISPTIILYEVYPKVGTRISKIKNLKNEIALNISARSIRIIAPIPGKGSIGIEIPNHNRDYIYMKDILFSEENNKKIHKMELPILLGKTVFNKNFFIDLAQMPHLLIAGATGQGKSVGLNVMIIFLLYKKNPENIKFILIDPKKVELSIYRKISKSYFATIPNSIDPIITDFEKAKDILNSLCKEMDKRYSILEKNKVRNIQEYNIKHNKKYHIPYIILVIDEFADLNFYFRKNKIIETYIVRLAQIARAVGIHMIIATQRPSVDVITGLIKSNFTARIAFRVSSKIDSKTILDCSGAEQLIGKGDFLFSNKNELIRLQCPFIDLSDIEKIVNFYKKYKKNEYFFLPKPD
ncbi:DNA translocase FtsK 4TM domain-containing protein [Blattabacterium cuenoti]|uniref:DNA translocase FtsK 4TM domain-containing protein n=1 Tax=Blattabacterium cuenoti TaxID=1653831 RepID=UPI00163C7243|nr:DNA translocase FtsK 4TM domain-containing protein [Blattabacterium cuenoti]